MGTVNNECWTGWRGQDHKRETIRSSGQRASETRDTQRKKKKKGNRERRRGGGTGQKRDTNTGLMTSCAAVAHECVEGEMEESGVVLGGLKGGGLSSPSPPKPIVALRRDDSRLPKLYKLDQKKESSDPKL